MALALALVAFVLLAHPSLVGLPLAALLIVAPPGPSRWWSLPLAGLIGGASVTLLFMMSTADGDTHLTAVTNAYIVIVTAAFIGAVLLAPAPALRQALRAVLCATVATAALIQLIWGSGGWDALAWEASHQARLALRAVGGRAADALGVYGAVVRFASLTWPGMLALQTLAGLALAWRLHLRLTSPAPDASSPRARFKDFYMGDGWVWGIVAWIAVLILPVSGALQVAGTNVGLVAGALYVLRGAAIVAAFAEAFGISTIILLMAGGAAAALALPLLFVVPGLCTLGITDTWYQYRRRLAEARRSTTT